MTDEDQELCLCFHVSRRKVIQFIRATKPRVASQLSECYGAGTGCGWCRPLLTRLLTESDPETVPLPDPAQYATDRAQYRASRKDA